MTLTELRYLVNLDKERHFSRAAERSFVSQPTLSVALKKLEEELGVALFERIRGEARPTPVGERIIAQAKRVLAEAKRVEDIAGEGKDELVGPLRLGAIYTVGPYLLPHLVPARSRPQTTMDGLARLVERAPVYAGARPDTTSVIQWLEAQGWTDESDATTTQAAGA